MIGPFESVAAPWRMVSTIDLLVDRVVEGLPDLDVGHRLYVDVEGDPPDVEAGRLQELKVRVLLDDGDELRAHRGDEIDLALLERGEVSPRSRRSGG